MIDQSMWNKINEKKPEHPLAEAARLEYERTHTCARCDQMFTYGWSREGLYFCNPCHGKKSARVPLLEKIGMWLLGDV